MSLIFIKCPHCGMAVDTTRIEQQRDAALAKASRLEQAWRTLRGYRGVTWSDEHSKERIGMAYNGDPEMAAVSLNTDYEPGEFIEDLDKWIQELCRAALGEKS